MEKIRGHVTVLNKIEARQGGGYLLKMFLEFTGLYSLRRLSNKVTDTAEVCDAFS